MKAAIISKIMEGRYLVPSVVAVSLVAAALAAPALALAVEDYLSIEKAEVTYNEELKVELDTHGIIPTDGSGGAFGYGVITDSGDILVATTHGGVYDSEVQTAEGAEPTWHNHYVTLDTGNEDCVDEEINPDGLHVVDITFGSPGQVEINDSSAELKDVPTEYDSEDSRTGNDLEIEAGTPGTVVSFTERAELPCS